MGCNSSVSSPHFIVFTHLARQVCACQLLRVYQSGNFIPATGMQASFGATSEEVKEWDDVLLLQLVIIHVFKIQEQSKTIIISEFEIHHKQTAAGNVTTCSL